MTRLYKTKRKVSAYPHLRRLYYNNCKRLKYQYAKLEQITMIHSFGVITPEKEAINNAIDKLIDMQLAIRDQSRQLVYKDIFYKKDGLSKRMKDNYVTAALNL